MRTQCGHVDFLKVAIQAKSLKRLVVCAVRYEPVSTSNSLLKALLQGIFVKNCLFCEFAPEFCTYNQATYSQIPY